MTSNMGQHEVLNHNKKTKFAIFKAFKIETHDFLECFANRRKKHSSAHVCGGYYPIMLKSGHLIANQIR